MPATLSADAALASARAPTLTEAQGYHSLHGDFSYYPTSAHKRRAPLEARGEEVVVNTKRVVAAPLSSSTDLDGGAVTSPSSSGLSCSPSKGTSDISSLARRSSSRPLASTPHEGNAARKPAFASLSFTKGGAPLLHRYRTSRADVSPRVLHRSASLPSQVCISTPVVTGAATRRPKNIRHSLLHTRSAAPSEPFAALAPPHNDAVTQKVASREPRATPLRTHSVPLYTTSSFSRKRVDNPDAEVPLSRVRLVEAAPASLSSSQKNAAASVAPATASEHTTSTPDVDRAHVESDAHGTGRRQGVGTASFSARTHSCPSLSRSVDTAMHCHGRNCMHSEQSICEFIHMQRELRRCYATIESYEVVVAQLRDDCALAVAQLSQSRQECAQHKKESEAQVREEVSEKTDAQRLALRRSETGDGTYLKLSAGSDESVKEAAEECLIDTLQTTIDKLRCALQNEQSAHAESLARLTEALTSKARWKSRAVKLLKWREQVCPHVRMSSAPSSSALAAAGTSSIGTSMAMPVVSAIGNCADDSQTELDAGGSASNVPTLSRRHDRLPSSREQLSCVSSPSEVGKLRSSVISEVRGTSSALLHEGGTGGWQGYKENEKDSNSMRGVDGSYQSDSTAASFSSSNTAPEGRVAKAAGSRVVVVWPPFAEEQERPPGGSAESSRTQPSKTGAALEARATALFENNGEHGAQPSPPISPISSAAQPGGLGDYTTSGGKSPAVEGCRSFLAGCEGALAAAAPQPAVPDPFPFPKPSPSAGVVCTSRGCLPPSDTPSISWDVSSTMAPDFAQRKCKELLRALLDKEHQLALIAEERTKYKQLYEAIRS
ncbi:hypothetical protein CUR178_08291 [Leishmania enriettii]|uniref:Uncharacterized protein n=1 Tax=Leishmania enriettii TaxID=5663 RepID=A0A836H2K2_LEIEN|nr:hypothetical protein CUR178_08291 [Leishmania enriettii]